jgi:hypothetical protein
MVNRILNQASIFFFHFCSLSGVAKHNWRFMPFSDSACIPFNKCIDSLLQQLIRLSTLLSNCKAAIRLPHAISRIFSKTHLKLHEAHHSLIILAKRHQIAFETVAKGNLLTFERKY